MEAVGERLGEGGGGRREGRSDYNCPIETTKALRVVTSSEYIMLLCKSPAINRKLNPEVKSSLQCLLSAYITGKQSILFPSGPKDQRTQDLYQSSQAQQETVPGTASCQNTTKHGERPGGT